MKKSILMLLLLVSCAHTEYIKVPFVVPVVPDTQCELTLYQGENKTVITENDLGLILINNDQFMACILKKDVVIASLLDAIYEFNRVDN